MMLKCIAISREVQNVRSLDDPFWQKSEIGDHKQIGLVRHDISCRCITIRCMSYRFGLLHLCDVSLLIYVPIVVIVRVVENSRGGLLVWFDLERVRASNGDNVVNIILNQVLRNSPQTRKYNNIVCF